MKVSRRLLRIGWRHAGAPEQTRHDPMRSHTRGICRLETNLRTPALDRRTAKRGHRAGKTRFGTPTSRPGPDASFRLGRPVYASERFHTQLSAFGINASMSRRGNNYDIHRTSDLSYHSHLHENNYALTKTVRNRRIFLKTIIYWTHPAKCRCMRPQCASLRYQLTRRNTHALASKADRNFYATT